MNRLPCNNCLMEIKVYIRGKHMRIPNSSNSSREREREMYRYISRSEIHSIAAASAIAHPRFLSGIKRLPIIANPLPM